MTKLAFLYNAHGSTQLRGAATPRWLRTTPKHLLLEASSRGHDSLRLLSFAAGHKDSVCYKTGNFVWFSRGTPALCQIQFRIPAKEVIQSRNFAQVRFRVPSTEILVNKCTVNSFRFPEKRSLLKSYSCQFRVPTTGKFSGVHNMVSRGVSWGPDMLLIASILK